MCGENFLFTLGCMLSESASERKRYRFSFCVCVCVRKANLKCLTLILKQFNFFGKHFVARTPPVVKACQNRLSNRRTAELTGFFYSPLLFKTNCVLRRASPCTDNGN